MRRAENVMKHPESSNKGNFTLNIEYSAESGEIVGGNLDHRNIAHEALVYLATEMRPIIFLEQKEDTHIVALSERIEEEHPYVRGNLQPLRDDYDKWKETLIIGLKVLGPAETPMPEGEMRLTSVMTGPPNTLPPDTDVKNLATDFHYARLYLYGEVWHSDDKKIAEYERASPLIKRHMEKCAELRVLSAIPMIRALHGWILAARGLGVDV